MKYGIHQVCDRQYHNKRTIMRYYRGGCMIAHADVETKMNEKRTGRTTKSVIKYNERSILLHHLLP